MGNVRACMLAERCGVKCRSVREVMKRGCKHEGKHGLCLRRNEAPSPTFSRDQLEFCRCDERRAVLIDSLQPNTMRLLQVATAALLPLTSLAAKKPTGDRFLDLYSKQASNATPVKLDDNSYAEVTKAPRNYSAAILLTALDPRFGLSLCKDFQPEWDLLAQSWTNGDKEMESRLIFGTLDFVDGKNTFQSVRPGEQMNMLRRR